MTPFQQGSTMYNQKIGISVVFPSFNEEENIERAVRATTDVLELIVSDYEIIIVNDASTDATGDIAESLAEKNGKISVIHHKKNKKLGGALKTGFAKASKELVLYSDVDLPFDFMEVSKALRIMEYTGADIVSAYRHDRISEGVKRAVYSYIYNAMVRLLFGLRVRDINFSFKLFKRNILDRIELVSNGSFIDAELLIKSQKNGFQIVQMGVDFFPRLRGSSTLSSPSVIFNILSDMLALLFQYKFKRFLGPENNERG